MIKNVRKRQLEFLGRVVGGRDGMENLFIAGFIGGKRGRGRKRTIFIESLCKWMKEKTPDINFFFVCHLI